jgi:hypothetical protein
MGTTRAPVFPVGVTRPVDLFHESVFHGDHFADARAGVDQEPDQRGVASVLERLAVGSVEDGAYRVERDDRYRCLL